MKKAYYSSTICIICLVMVAVVSGEIGSYTEHFDAIDLLNKTHYADEPDEDEIMQQAATERCNLVANSTEKLIATIESEDPAPSEPPITTPYVPGEVIIMYQPVSSMSSQRAASYAVNAVPDAEITEDFSASGLNGLAKIELAEDMSVEDALEAYSDSPYVAYAEPNYIIQLYLPPADTNTSSGSEEGQTGSNSTISAVDLLSSMNDPLFPNLWGLHNDGSAGGTADADIDAPEAWAQTTGSSDVVVAVIDTGIDYTHPDLAANIWTNPGEIANNNIDDDNNGYVDDVHGWDFVNDDNDPMDDQGHGTHCAGTIGAVGNNGIGVSGVSWKTRLMPLKFLDAAGQGDTAGALNAINYARTMGADILSCSWGSNAESQAMYDAFSQVPVLIVCAAGNQGSDNDATGHYPSNFNLDQILSVAATTDSDGLASFSNYGKTKVDVAAPGNHIASCAPSSKYVYLSGTSMATPHVSGLAVLLESMKPGASAQQIKQLIMQNTDSLSALSGKTVSGGRINAEKAVSAASGSSSAKQTYSITASAGTGGSVTPAGKTTVTKGTDITYTISPQSGYATSSIIVDGKSVTIGTTYKFSSVSQDHTITASFVKKTYTITSSAGTGGTISPAGQITVSAGSGQTYSITPGSGYQVSSVLVDGVSAGPVTQYQFNQITSGHTITASFAKTSSGSNNILSLPTQQLKPTDPDGNSLYEDLNGNGRKDFQDVVLYFTYLEWISVNEPVTAFDYSGNKRIDFSDVIQLFQMIR